jgi:hypothetical protein
MKKNKKDLKNEQDSRMIKREKIKRLVLKLKVKEIENPDNKLCVLFFIHFITLLITQFLIYFPSNPFTTTMKNFCYLLPFHHNFHKSFHNNDHEEFFMTDVAKGFEGKETKNYVLQQKSDKVNGNKTQDLLIGFSISFTFNFNANFLVFFIILLLSSIFF